MNLTRFDLIVFVSVFFVALYIYGKRKYKHFRNTGMKYVEPKIPFFGSTIKVLMQREHFSEFLMHHYNLFPDEKYIGLFEVQRPLILIRDLELLRKIGIKDFNHFMNHRSVISEELDPLFGKNLFSLQGEKWRDMRSTLSPAFTSSKMKNMFILIDECAKDVADFYLSEINNSKNGTIVIEAKDTFTRYTNDVIANSAFGLKVNSLKIKDNQFYRLAKIATNFSGVQIIKFAAYALFPKLMKVLDVQFIDPEAKSFFREIVRGTILYREENKIERHDMIHLLMEAQKGSLKHEVDSATLSEAGYAAVQESMIGKQVVKRKWSDDEIVAQALIFLIGGFDTTATLISFLFYELVRNTEIQKRLQQEIDNFKFKTGGILSYENLQSLKYLDMCVSETLRMWPPAVAIDRVCTNGYNLPPANETCKTTYKVNADESVWIPVYAIHNDPKYFPNPSQFDPERFSDENRSALEQNAYMPFGVGPRNCIGSRFALMVVKTITFHIVSKFDIEITDKTQIPVELAKNTLNLVSKNGIYIGLKPRINVEK